MQVARVKRERCSTADCNRCIRVCPVSHKDKPVIYIGRNKKATVIEELCNGCGKCVRICPEKAIEMITIPDPVDETTAAIDFAEISAETVTDAAVAVSMEEPKQIAPPRKKTPEEKVASKKIEYSARVVRTLIACTLGLIAGIASFFLAGTPDAEFGEQAAPLIGILILLVAVVIQRTIFRLIWIDTKNIGMKDWFYQVFMTFVMWYLTWTMILTTSLLPRP